MLNLILAFEIIAIATTAYILTINFTLLNLAMLLVWLYAFSLGIKAFRQEKKITEKVKAYSQSRPINNSKCKYYCDYNFGVCAVNPTGSCQGCQDYEPINLKG